MKKSTKIIIAVVSVLVVAAIVFAVLFFATDLFKTKNPKKAFYENLDKVAIGEGDFSYSDLIAKLKEFQGKSYEGKGKISMDIELGSSMANEDYADVIEVLNDAEISYETKFDAKNSRSAGTANITYNGKDLGKVEMVVDDGTIGLKIEEVTDKYLTITVEELLEALDLDSISSSTSSVANDIDMNEVVDILNISNDEIKRITDRYKKVLEDAIPEDNYSSEKEKITVNGKEINTTAYSVKISEKDLAKVVKKLLESLQEDDDTITLAVDKINKLMKLADKNSDKLTKSNVKALIKSAISEFDDLSDFSNEKMEITLYEYKDSIARIQFSMDEDAIIIDTLKDGDTSTLALTVKADGEEMKLLTVETTKKGDNSYSTKLSTDLQGIEASITLDLEATDTTVKEAVEIYCNVPTMIKGTVKFEVEAEYKSVDVDRLSSSNTTSISSLTETDQINLLVKYVDKHMDAIKEIATKMGFEDEIEELESQINALKSSTQPTSTTPDADDSNNDDSEEVA